MKKPLSNKKKFILLIASSIAFGILSYSLSIKNTLDQREQYLEFLRQQEVVSGIGLDLRKWEELNASIGSYNKVHTSNFQEQLLNEIGQFCHEHKLRLSDFSEPFTGHEDGFNIETVIINVEGGFLPLLKLVYHLENNFEMGKLASVSYQKKKNLRANKEELFLQMYIQQIQKKDEKEK